MKGFLEELGALLLIAAGAALILGALVALLAYDV